MKNIITSLILMMFISVADINAYNIDLDQTDQSKFISVIPDKMNNVFLIKFKSLSDQFVVMKIKCNDKEIQVLVESEISKGQYGIYFRPPQELKNKNFTCEMLIYDAGQNNLILSDSEIFSFSNR